jgi:hypothetical protein
MAYSRSAWALDESIERRLEAHMRRRYKLQQLKENNFVDLHKVVYSGGPDGIRSRDM